MTGKNHPVSAVDSQLLTRGLHFAMGIDSISIIESDA